MTGDKSIEQLIADYCDGSISRQDAELLYSLLEQNHDYRSLFLNVRYSETELKVSYMAAHDVDIDNAYAKLCCELASSYNRNRRIKRFRLMSVGIAVVAIVLLSVYFFLPYSDVVNPEKVSIHPGMAKAVLYVSGDSKVYLSEETSDSKEVFHNRNFIVNNSQQGLAYDNVSNSERNEEELEYHTLFVPRGGEYSVKLADGTHVWLNSESKLRYPASYIDGTEYKVQIEGEAYFKVSKRHDSHFVVICKNQEIKVLGTEFNVNSFNNRISTTLVNGKVELKIDTAVYQLRPEQHAILNDNIIKIVNVDTDKYISWKYGRYVFENTPLCEIMETLSRWYDFSIIYADRGRANKLHFTGEMSRDSKIQDILAYIQNTNTVKFTLKGKYIIIN